MKRMVLVLSILLAMGVLLLTPSVRAEQVEFNYNGRVNVGGEAFDGTGLFKFALVNKDGDVSYWSNDGTSEEGSQPDKAIGISVQDGFFDVAIGDPELGMAPLNAAIFNEKKVYLRVWFSDGSHGFERLRPDRRIVNPSLLGVRSDTEDFTLYVNGTTGDDKNSGFTTDTAKRTIQAAVDLLPERLKCNATIKIANGVYRETVTVSGIFTAFGRYLTLLGDESVTDTATQDPGVRITGLDDDATSVSSRDWGIMVNAANDVYVRNITVDHCHQGIEVRNAFATIVRCKVQNNGTGIYVRDNSTSGLYDCVAKNNANGISIWHNSSASLFNVTSTYNTVNGLSLLYGHAMLYQTGNFSHNQQCGMDLYHHSSVWFIDYTNGHIDYNGQYGARIYWQSHSRFISIANTLTGNTLGKMDVQYDSLGQ